MKIFAFSIPALAPAARIAGPGCKPPNPPAAGIFPSISPRPWAATISPGRTTRNGWWRWRGRRDRRFRDRCRWQDGAYRHDGALLAPFCGTGFGLALAWHNGAETVWAEPQRSRAMELRARALAAACDDLPAQTIDGRLPLMVEAPKRFGSVSVVTALLREVLPPVYLTPTAPRIADGSCRKASTR